MKQLVLLSLAWCVLLKCCGYCSSVELQQLKQQTDPEQTPTSSGGGGGLSVGDVAAIASTIGVFVAAIVAVFTITAAIVGIWKNCKEQPPTAQTNVVMMNVQGNNGVLRDIADRDGPQHPIDRPAIPVAAADNHSDSMALQPMSHTGRQQQQQEEEEEEEQQQQEDEQQQQQEEDEQQQEEDEQQQQQEEDEQQQQQQEQPQQQQQQPKQQKEEEQQPQQQQGTPADDEQRATDVSISGQDELAHSIRSIQQPPASSSTDEGLACVVFIPEALVEKVVDLRISFANLTYSFKEEVKKSPELQEKFEKLLPQLLTTRAIDDRRSYFEILVEEEVSFFNTHYLKQLCTKYPEDFCATTRQLVDEYEQQRQDFMTSATVSQFKQLFPETATPSSKLLTGKVPIKLKLKNKWGTGTLQDLTELIKFDVLGNHLHLSKIERGCIAVTWLGSTTEVKQLKMAILEAAGSLQTMGVLQVFIGEEEELVLECSTTDPPPPAFSPAGGTTRVVPGSVADSNTQQTMAVLIPSDSDEKSVFTSFSSRIISSVNFYMLVPGAFSVALISQREKADCFTKKDQMGDLFVEIMIRKINTSTTNFYTLVQLLKSLGKTEIALARDMEAAVGVYRGEDRIPADTLQKMNLGLGAGTQTTVGSDAEPSLHDLQYMSYTSEDGRTVSFRLMDRIKPQVTGLAIALNFPNYVINNLETKQDPVFYLLEEWLRGDNQEHDSRPLTWGTLITALGEAGLLEEVKILEQHFVATPLVAMRGGSPAGDTTRVVPGSVAGQDPSWPLLIFIKKPDGGALRIMDTIVDFHDKNQCIQFAHILLKSRQDLMRIVYDSSKQEKKDFVPAVLDKWLSSGSSSWQQLVGSMRGAGMDKTATDEIDKYVLGPSNTAGQQRTPADEQQTTVSNPYQGQGITTGKVTRRDLQFLVRALNEVHHNWNMFGTALGLSQRKLHDIEKEGPRIDLSSFMKEALEVWLSMVDIEHTWWHVIEAVENSGMSALARRLREKHRDHLKDDLTKDPDTELLGKMLSELDEMIPQWSNFCLILGLEVVQLQTIEQQTPIANYTRTMLKSWIDEKAEQATIHKILEALESPTIANNALAKSLKENEQVQEMMKRKAPASSAAPMASASH